MTTTRQLSLPGPDNIVRVVLENGITVLVYENHAAQSVVVAGTVTAGSINEDPAQSGLASMTASALMRGAEHRDFDAIHASLENAGADLNVSGGPHNTTFHGKALAEDLSLLVDILDDVLRYPTFPAVQVERLRGEIITGLHIRQQDTRYRANRAFREHLYPTDHPYHHSSSGTLDTVPQLAVSDLQAFHRRHYGPQGMIVVVVGAVSAQAAIDVIRERLGAWRNPQPSTPSTLPNIPVVAETRRAFVSVPGKTQSDIVLGVPGPSRFAPDYQAATLANSILGQFGMMGRIGDSVREKLGLAYYAYSRIEGGHGPAPWSVVAGVNPANVELAIERSVDEIRRLTTEPVSDEDLADNQSYFTGHLPLQLEDNDGIAFTLLNMETYNLGLDYLVTYHDTIYALTRDDLLAAARRYLNPDAFVVAVAGPDGS